MPDPVFPALDRRSFLRTGAAAVAFPFLAASGFAGPFPPSGRLGIAVVGVGLQASGLLSGLVWRRDARIVALCDVSAQRLGDARERVRKHHDDGSAPFTTTRFEEVVARADVDVVFVVTPDHWHAPITLAALRAGKDVYCEKPLTLTVREGRVVADAARRLGRVVQTGSQQRSEGSFRRAVEIVRRGWIGEVERVLVRLGEFPPARDLPEEPVPEGFDYDRWLGPAPWRPYNAERVRGDYGGGWRCFEDYGGRKNGDWGAHHFDIVQWALNLDASGPVRFIPRGHEGTEFQTHVYADGTRVERVNHDREAGAMIEFRGTEGVVFVGRDNDLRTRPADLVHRRPGPSDFRLPPRVGHVDDFLACVRTRQAPQADAEVGHRTATICHLNNIAARLGRPLHWDPVRETTPDDPAAARLLERPRRDPHALL